MDWEDYINNIWVERLIWVRQLILSIILGLRDASFVAQRVERNSMELGQILASVFGAQAGQDFEDLLGRYIRNLNEVASTIKSGQNTDILMEQWYSIATEIAEFLFQINPYWEKSAVEALIRDQLELEYDFALQLNNENFQQGIADFDPAYDNAQRAGRLMVYGIKMHMGLQ